MPKAHQIEYGALYDVRRWCQYDGQPYFQRIGEYGISRLSQLNWWFLLAIVAARGDNVTLIPGLRGGGHAVGRECLAQMIQIHGPVLA
jgi:hypothetical protein